jgi:ABC-2 type transport system permease protein
MRSAAIDAQVPGTVRQVSALMRMELLALRRNKTATAMAVVTPLAVGMVLAGAYDGGSVAGVERMASVLALSVVLGVHHHLVTVYASRRQELVLKRLRAGLPSDGTILAGAAAATLGIFLIQAVILAGYGVIVLGLPAPENPLFILLALALGAAVMAAFSAALSAITVSSEAAMLTSLPTSAIFLLTPGALIPLGTLPDNVEAIARHLPLGSFTEVIREAWLGYGVLDMLPALGVLAIWLALASLLARAVFRWEPRASA